MDLSADVFHTAVNSAAGETGERRKHQRVPFRFKIKIVPYENGVCGDSIFVWTRDIGAGGIGLIHNKPMREGSRFITRLTRPDATPIILLCTVRNCIKLTTDVFGIGASFAELVTMPHQDAPATETKVVTPVAIVADNQPPPALSDEVRRISDAILS